MPSSYTTNLRLTLPATGENSGTWGPLVNNGITILIDTSIAGTANVTMTDANYVLTSINGATDEARSMFITLSGTLSTTRNVICPSVSKLYIVTNNTTGGQSIVFTTLAGTGITVPNGRRAIVYCNGTDVVSAFDYFSGPYVIEANSASSALRVTQVGSGNAILVEDSANPDSSPFVVDATGNVGIGTTTPAANGLDVVRNGATALVRVLQSDSGAGTFARLLVSKTSGPSVETLLDSAAAYFGTVGSHPLLIETNATERVRITASGLVGINTSTPDANLTVNGVASFSAGTALLPSIAQAGDLNTGMWFPAADTLAWSTAGTERLRIGASGAITLPDLTASTALALDASKNVVSVTNTGTGNNVLATSPTLITPDLGTPSAIVLTNASGTASININGTVGATTPTTGAFTTVAASGARGFRNTNAFATVETIQSAGGVGFRWGLANDGNYYMQRTADGFATAASTPMFVGSNDRIGIGTTSPDALLTVAGVAAFAAGTALLPSLAATGDLDTGIWFPAANTVAWSTGGTERMRITSTGAVGIGTSATPQGIVEISGSRVNGDILTVRSVGTSQYAMGGVSMLNAATSNNKGVSMGTAVRDSDGSDSVFLMFATNSSGQFLSTLANYDLTDDFWLFATAGQERMRITSAGNVGINTTTPAAGARLDVVGNIHATQRLQLTSTVANLSLLEVAGGTGYRWTLANNGTYRLQRTANGTYSDATTPILMDASCVGLGSINSQSWAASNGGGGAAFSWNRSNGSAEMNIVNQYDNASLSFEFAQKTGASTASVLYSFGLTGHLWYISGAEKMRIDSAGDVGINESDPDYKLDVNGTFGFTPGASVTPVDNGDVVFEATNNTTFTVKLKGSDGTVRTGTITLA